jgi:hypothetical protein
MDKQCMLEIQTALKDKGLDGLAFLRLSARGKRRRYRSEMSSDPKF